jgi:hypothetical protein
MLIAELKLKSPAAKSNMASTNSKLYGLCFSRKIISIINWGMSPKITANALIYKAKTHISDICLFDK